ncbi:tripartite tricarboxylate transporter substrate binding protein [Variovorax sp. J22R133]|uniref:Bug family tripartite tricarboxylate transporter substrate binding protein n=1 Tax=Variovorax brevis TaxID=3053503 RepID=UPI002575283C|nr:tripartite tricarboxylate transporter substrate binding protein [Variovorax sp. J22R133]MDM0116265.1 tripartite tricarboxylate transporter substrate binding protein [Variovorax sp. J22R133]
MKLLVRNCFAVILSAVGVAGHAEYPDKPIKIIVPFGVGGATDALAREFGQSLAAVTRQPVIIDNRPGADGAIGSQAAARSSPDGYTALIGSNSTQVLNGLINKTLSYDAAKDFAPICMLGKTSSVMFIRSTLPYKTLPEMIAAAKAAPGKFTFGYVSTGTRVPGELLQQKANIKLLGVPYKSTGTALMDIVGGQVDMVFFDRVSGGPMYEQGKIRALAVTGTHRLKSMPNIPTAAESGVSNYEMSPWFGIYLPIQTPAPVVAQFIEAVTKAAQAPAVQAGRERLDVEYQVVCGPALAKFQAEEVERWSPVIRQANIKTE